MLKKHSRSTVGPNSVIPFFFNLVSILTYLILQFFIVQKISITVLYKLLKQNKGCNLKSSNGSFILIHVYFQ